VSRKLGETDNKKYWRLSQATHKLNGFNDFRIGDLRKFRFDLRQYRVETLKLGSSILARLLRQLLRHLQYSSTSKFQ
jgi:hypothetical protein